MTTTKAQRFLRMAIPAFVLYILAYLHIIPLPFISTASADAILPILPWYLLITFGAYSLSSLGLGLLRFNDCPEAYESLLVEIQQAKTELRNQGVDVD